MTQTEIKDIISAQRTFFAEGHTQNVKYRVAALKKLRASLLTRQKQLEDALKSDLGKSASESYMCEIGMVLSELSYMIKMTPKFSRRRKVKTPLAQFASRSYSLPSPYGTVLIMSPWNYPLLLTLDPLVDALAAGNTAVVKPSAYSPATSAIIGDILKDCFPSEYVAVISGGREENRCLLAEKFDYIFFTGSKAVGHDVMRAAAEYLTPVTLELGGKSPCIVDASAKISLAAKRIVFGKYLNCGQTCVAPDYILCHESVKEQFIAEVTKQITKQFGSNPLNNPSYGKIINAKHFTRILSLIEPSKVVCGGESQSESQQIAPTVMKDVSWEDAVMQEEIFGPIMPILTFSDRNDVIVKINARPHPLALYVFASDKKFIREVTSRCNFGGGCLNDTIIHLASDKLGFGGVGESGMGAYHGKIGFDTFSHKKSIVDKKTWIDLPMRYQPYTESGDKLIKMFLK